MANKQLQSETTNASEATDILQKTLSFLVNSNSEETFKNMLEEANQLAESFGCDKNFNVETEGRLKKRKMFFDEDKDEEQATNPETKFKLNFFFVVLEKSISSVKERFRCFKEIVSPFEFLINLETIKSMTDEDLKMHCHKIDSVLTDGDSKDIDGDDLYFELKSFVNNSDQSVNPKSALKYISDRNLHEIYPNLCICLKKFLTLPVTVASGERTFSKLKLIKNYLRSTMSQERLNGLAIISINMKFQIT